jgi:hypothetical protein
MLAVFVLTFTPVPMEIVEPEIGQGTVLVGLALALAVAFSLIRLRRAR